jgi:U3 small nucleolar RNA-associated protein 22
VLSANHPMSINHLSPSHSNIRFSSSEGNSQQTSHTTPAYNTALLCSLLPKAQMLAIHTAKQQSAAFQDALSLLRIWANQRGFGSGAKICVRGFEDRGSWWSSLLETLINGEEPSPQTSSAKGHTKFSKRRPLGKGLSSYQLFRGALDFLCRSRFDSFFSF